VKKELAVKLYDKANEVAFHFSNPDREFNTTKESFTVRKIIPLSDLTATVQFEKSSGKIGLAFFYWIKSSGGYWQYFFPTDSHIIGMNRMKDMLHNVEQHNFDKNFI
tara:strand:- start:34242 stop:34562 length:321 start_codon:yes stop_codon:yes gene_type:complete